MINAGIDCIEHGTGVTDDTIELMVEHGTALVPTLINIENFPSIAASADRYPTYAAHMRDLHARCHSRIAAARDAGIAVYAGTDAGTMVAHGRIADEVEALKRIGMSPIQALGAASWDAGAGWAVPASITAHRQICCATTTIRGSALAC
ncbi:amidohydrolase family protein [Mycobacterium xenopi 4042]|uniref:Amidohydrolase family protein n=1 Tax=Mycobacterium xenopi 4042 TaxID=1299334 RepID=X8E935_MYCXE|nr:amidohydrolase family protein [Mycobacterium xenopi 4042]